MYNAGFAVFTLFSILLSATWMHGTAAVLWLVVMRILQGVGGAMLMANSNAIITDVFPVEQRGLALGLNQVAGIGGSFIGLILGGLLGPIDWRLVFLVSVPIGLFGTVWAYLRLHDTGIRQPARLDWWGNVTFAARADRRAGRHHLRHPAVPRAHHGLVESGGGSHLARRGGGAGRLLRR